MATAYGKDVSDWLKTDDTWELVSALAQDLGVDSNSDKNPNSVKTRVAASFPSLITSRRGSPENGGGTWIHPDLAVEFAGWCNKMFAIQVGRWVREWFASGHSPIQPDIDRQIETWEQRYNFRIHLKDVLRVELMEVVIQWAQQHGKSPITVCSEVHDLMNERVQGYKSKQISTLGGLPLGDLIRDYFGANALVLYSSINTLAKNAILDRDLDPISAVNEACDSFLGKRYQPKLAKIQENVYREGRRLKTVKKNRQLQQGVQLNLFDSGLAG